jgi:transcription antitermination factor NusA-like protein
MSGGTLSTLLSNGWIAHMRGVIELVDAPLAKDKIEEIKNQTNNTATHIVFLHQGVGGKGVCYPITNKEELELANREVKKSWEIIGYVVNATCKGRNLIGEEKIDEYANNIKELTGWKIEIVNESLFTAQIEIEGVSKEIGYRFISDLQNHLICTSLKNKAGIMISGVNWSPKYKAQPIASVTGAWTRFPDKINLDEVDKTIQLIGGSKKKLACDLIEFYSQDSARTKLITGFSIIEHLFDSKSENILSKQEKKDVMDKIKEIPSIASDDSKINKIINVLNNPTMSKLNRNERLAVKLAEVMKVQYDDAYKKIKELAEFRGKAAHSITEDEPEFSNLSDYIEHVLLKYLYS